MNDSSGSQKFWGKYRGTVINNVDPENRARLQVMVTDVLSLIPSSWAECCAPLSGMTGAAAGMFMVPPIGAAVWVEFEQGDPSFPIWTGCWYGHKSELPPAYQSMAGLNGPPLLLERPDVPAHHLPRRCVGREVRCQRRCQERRRWRPKPRQLRTRRS